MKQVKKILILALAGLVVALSSLPAVSAATKININTAPKEELITLKYVGEAIADRIIEYRTQYPFQAPEDIMKVKGIGQKIFEANKDIIVVKNE